MLPPSTVESGRTFRPPPATGGFEGRKAKQQTAEGSRRVEREAERERVGRAERQPPADAAHGTRGGSRDPPPASLAAARVLRGGRLPAGDCASGGIWRIARSAPRATGTPRFGANSTPREHSRADPAPGGRLLSRECCGRAGISLYDGRWDGRCGGGRSSDGRESILGSGGAVRSRPVRHGIPGGSGGIPRGPGLRGRQGSRGAVVPRGRSEPRLPRE